MTAPTSERPRFLTSNRVYSAAIFAIGMAVPHLVIGLQAHWPPQLMSAHVLAVVLLLFTGARLEHVEHVAEETARRRAAEKKSRKKPVTAGTAPAPAPTEEGGEEDSLRWLDQSLRDDPEH